MMDLDMEPALERHVYPGYTQAELDLAYSQRDWAGNADQILGRWKSGVDAVRAASLGYREFRYGTEADEVIDLYPAPGRPRYAHFHIHGGAWRSQSKEDCAFLAPVMRNAAVNFVVPEFGKLPQHRLPHVLNQLIRALVWTYDNQVKTGKVEKILISGHSSGAHMAALLSMQDWRSLGMDAAAVLGVVCISGAYDLEPVLLSSRGSYVHLNDAEAEQLSPILHAGRACVPLHVLYGTNESPEFIRQASAFARALKRDDKLAACLEITGKNHFEILDALSSPDEAVTRHVLKLFREPNEARHRPNEASI
jgi:arylformamidase